MPASRKKKKNTIQKQNKKKPLPLKYKEASSSGRDPLCRVKREGPGCAGDAASQLTLGEALGAGTALKGVLLSKAPGSRAPQLLIAHPLKEKAQTFWHPVLKGVFTTL